VASDRLLAILELLARDGGEDYPHALCSVATEITGLSGAGITLLSVGPHYTAFGASDLGARQLLDLEVTLGEGPGVDACRSIVAREVEDLFSVRSGDWVTYAPAALAIGARAVFGFPIGIGAIRIGALVMYRTQPGPLSELQESDAYLMASVVARSILATRAGATRTDLSTELALSLSFDFSVHQAAGMVAVQGEMDLSDAYVALRGHAFGSGVSMTSLARSVVRRETFYDPTTGGWYERNTESR
jgi:hypothetical protein